MRATALRNIKIRLKIMCLAGLAAAGIAVSSALYLLAINEVERERAVAAQLGEASLRVTEVLVGFLELQTFLQTFDPEPLGDNQNVFAGVQSTRDALKADLRNTLAHLEELLGGEGFSSALSELNGNLEQFIEYQDLMFDIRTSGSQASPAESSFSSIEAASLRTLRASRFLLAELRSGLSRKSVEAELAFEDRRSDIVRYSVLLSLLLLGIVAVGGTVFARSIAQRIESIAEEMTDLAEGRDVVSSKEVSSGDEIGDLARSFEVFRRNALELKQTLENLHLAKVAAGIGFWSNNVSTGEVVWDAQNALLHGRDTADLSGTYKQWSDVVHPDDLPRVENEYKQALSGEKPFDTEYRVVLSDGSIRHLKGAAVVLRDKAGNATGAVGANYDLSALRTKETELFRAQRIASQAQKMEGIGQLSGGIAHDFNNLLAVILGNLELLQDAEGATVASTRTERDDLISSAMEAAKRGADLTKKMLTFARQSFLEPVVLDINSVVHETERWLSRTIPSNIEIETNLQSRCWPTLLDRASLQSSIVNVVLNARDAMPTGGKLTIETSNLRVDESHIDDIEEDVPAGRYVLLAITDTGNGISRDDLSKIFDPFFSTKEMGFGTGLGLSMVQGFVKQSSGFVTVYSELGEGTSIKLYFPAIDDRLSDTQAPVKDAGTIEDKGHCHSILLVDDQLEILDVLRKVLGKRGYVVGTASSGDQAEKVYQETGPYDLLITDVVMPGRLQGPDLARALRAKDDRLPVIFMSGYAREATVHGNGLRASDIRLMKPVSRTELLKAVEQALSKT